MKTKYIEQTICYTGEQLRSNYAYTEFDIIGDSMIAFCGPCDVSPDYMVDLKDLKDRASIYSESMVHFIIEYHDMDLEKAVLRQLMLATIVCETLNHEQAGICTRRCGSDLFHGDAKMSVSIATLTPLSSLIHFGINISSENTPVKTKGLKDFGIDPQEFARSVMKKYCEMQSGISIARCKVKWRA
jgi:hypothetical protein